MGKGPGAAKNLSQAVKKAGKVEKNKLVARKKNLGRGKSQRRVEKRLLKTSKKENPRIRKRGGTSRKGTEENPN